MGRPFFVRHEKPHGLIMSILLVAVQVICFPSELLGGWQALLGASEEGLLVVET